MQQELDYNDDYSTEYRARFAQALADSREIGFTRPARVSESTQVGSGMLKTISAMLNDFSAHLSMVCPGYWGNSCQTLSTNIFALLNAEGIPADIVVGNVIINGTDEFDATLDLIRGEVLGERPTDGPQSVHAWISVGDDTIIDAALAPRLAKYYGAPPHFDELILIGRASEFSVHHHLRYQPIVIGTEFFAQTNPPDPMLLLEAWSRAQI